MIYQDPMISFDSPRHGMKRTSTLRFRSFGTKTRGVAARTGDCSGATATQLGGRRSGIEGMGEWVLPSGVNMAG